MGVDGRARVAQSHRVRSSKAQRVGDLRRSAKCATHGLYGRSFSVSWSRLLFVTARQASPSRQPASLLAVNYRFRPSLQGTTGRMGLHTLRTWLQMTAACNSKAAREKL